MRRCLATALLVALSAGHLSGCRGPSQPAQQTAQPPKSSENRPKSETPPDQAPVAGAESSPPTQARPPAPPSPDPAEERAPVPVPAPVTVDVSVPPPWHRPGLEVPGIIDFHGHLGLSGADRIQRFMAANGIAQIINLSGGSGRGNGIGWKRALALSSRLPGKVVHFANVDWRTCCNKAWADREVQRLRFAVTRLGFMGLKISKALGLGATDEQGKLIAVDDPRLDPLWQEAARHQLPVSIHVADPLAFWLPVNKDNERYAELSAHPGWSYHKEAVPSWEQLLDASERLFARHPKTTFVAVHFGNAAEDITRVYRMLNRLPNVHVDIAARVG